MDIREYSVASALINEIESEQFSERRRQEYKGYKVSEGGQREYVLSALQKLFPKSWSSMRVSDISVSNKVLSKFSKAYKESPVRNLGTQTDDMNTLLSESDFDSRMAEFDRDYNRQRYGLLWVNSINDEPSFHSLKGFESFVKRDDDSGDLKAVVINYPSETITHNGNSNADGIEQNLSENQDDSSAESKLYAMWTNDFHAVWRVTQKKIRGVSKSSIERMEIEGNELGINDLGRLPFVYRSKNSSNDLPFVNQLTEQSITYNVLNSDFLTACALQGYGQLVVTMPEDMITEAIHTGMTTAMTLPIIEGADVQADAKYINPNPDLAGMKLTLDNYAGDITGEHLGQSQSVNSNQTFSSGLERVIAQADVTDIISGNQRVYSKMEKEVVEILRAYEFLGQGSAELTTIFPKAKVQISDKETLENIKMRLDLGLITKIEALQIIDPNLDENDATKKLEEIAKQGKILLDSFGGQDANKEGPDKLRVGLESEVEENTQGES